MKYLLLAVTLLGMTPQAFSQQINPIPAWADSFSRDGVCYIRSTLDHGIGDTQVQTNQGLKTVREIDAAQALGRPSRLPTDPIYNDVQCGNGPPNNGDEDPDACPGRVDQGAAGCDVIGPLWDLDRLFPGLDTPSPAPQLDQTFSSTISTDGVCSVRAQSLGEAITAFNSACAGATHRDCDPINGMWECSTVRIGSGGLTVLVGAPQTPQQPVVPVAPQQPVVPVAPQQPVEPVIVEPVPTPEPTPELTPVVPPVASGVCSVTGTNFSATAADFRVQCPAATHRDCDPVPGGLWMCSSEQIGSGGLKQLQGAAATAPIFQTPTTPTTPTTPAATPVTGNVIRIEAESDSATFWINENGNSLVWRTANFFTTPPNSDPLRYNFQVSATGTYQLRLRARAVQQTPGRTDLHNDVWLRLDGVTAPGFADVTDYVKVFTSGDGNYHISGTADPSTPENRTPFRQVLTQGVTYTLEALGRSQGYGIDYFEIFPISVAASTRPVPPLPPLLSSTAYEDTLNDSYENGDLLSMHYDSSFDPDDMQAMILNREMLDSVPNVDFIAVNGTKRRDHTFVLEGSTEHMLAMFPGGYDAFDAAQCTRPDTTTFCVETIQIVATQWELTLATGNRVHVAEGGPSTFTADVIRELIERDVSNEALKRIRVIQHSWGFNENNTPASDLDIVRRYADYIRIGNGNLDTGIHAFTSDFSHEANTAHANQFRPIASTSRYGTLWSYAFSRINNKADGSDAVETMWILGIPRAVAPDLLSFAARYF